MIFFNIFFARIKSVFARFEFYLSLSLFFCSPCPFFTPWIPEYFLSSVFQVSFWPPSNAHMLLCSYPICPLLLLESEYFLSSVSNSHFNPHLKPKRSFVQIPFAPFVTPSYHPYPASTLSYLSPIRLPSCHSRPTPPIRLIYYPLSLPILQPSSDNPTPSSLPPPPPYYHLPACHHRPA